MTVELDPLPAVTDALAAREPGAPLVHEAWGDNLFMTTTVGGDIDEIARRAPIKVERRYRMNRQCMAPLEGKGVLAYWDDHDDQLVVISSTQSPHMIRAGLSEFLGIEQRQLRVIAPDVGGGFGYKVVLQPEELCVAWLAWTRRHPVRWTEDRREHLTAGANTRQHHYRVAAYADERGKLLAVEAEITVDIGAYSVWPFSAGLEGAMAGGNLPGPYALPAYRCRTFSVATNKPPFVPYRAVARPGVCFAMELTLDAVARAVGREPAEVQDRQSRARLRDALHQHRRQAFRQRRLSRERAQRDGERIDLAAVRAAPGARRARRAAHRRRLLDLHRAVGARHLAVLASGARRSSRAGSRRRCASRRTAAPRSGRRPFARPGHGDDHGPGGVRNPRHPARAHRGRPWRHRDDAVLDRDLCLALDGDGGGRGIALVQGAGPAAWRGSARICCKAGSRRCGSKGARWRDRAARSRSARSPTSWYRRPEQLPADVDVGGLEATVGYKPKVDTGAFTYATHAAVVALDAETGKVDILDYVIVEDCGTMVNPMIVEGQATGGATQGIGTALYEEIPL